MSIFEETGGGLGAVAHDRSLELFFDRFEVIARFVALINEDPALRRVLYLHGLGGNGKSLLLRYLAARCCVRLPPTEWERVRRLPDAELPAALAGAAKAARVPVARIDFGARPVGENRPQECFSALFMLKQQLAQYRIGTPRFDFAAVTYLHKLGFDLDRRLPELFPRGELAVALDLADALLPVQVMQVGQSLFGAVDRRLDDVFTRRRVQRRLPKADAEEILSLAPEPDLIEQMPRLFAADLRAALGEKARHERVVLLFDTHEAFFGEAIADPQALPAGPVHCRGLSDHAGCRSSRGGHSRDEPSAWRWILVVARWHAVSVSLRRTGPRVRRWRMRAAVGDRFHVRGNIVGQPERSGEIVEVRGAGGEPPYLVRFDDGHTSLVFPGPDAVIEHPRKKIKKRPRKAE